MRKKLKLKRFKVIQLIQYFLVRFIVLILSIFSLRQALKFGKLCGAFIYFLDAKHREEAFDNISRAYGNFDTRQVYKLVLGVYQHIGISVVESLFLPRILRKENLSKYVKLEGFDIIDKLLAKGKGALVVVAHLGNWEIAALSVAISGYPITSVARPIDNPYLDKYLNRFRTSTGQNIIPKYSAVAAMSQMLAQNKMLIILADQDVRKHGVFVDFFGQPASTVLSPALLALRHNIPIVPANMYRDEKLFIHKAIITEPIYLDGVSCSREAKMEKLTASYTARLEEFIRQHPDQWVWIHRRWKTKKPSTS